MEVEVNKKYNGRDFYKQKGQLVHINGVTFVITDATLRSIKLTPENELTMTGVKRSKVLLSRKRDKDGIKRIYDK